MCWLSEVVKCEVKAGLDFNTPFRLLIVKNNTFPRIQWGSGDGGRERERVEQFLGRGLLGPIHSSSVATFKLLIVDESNNNVLF